MATTLTISPPDARGVVAPLLPSLPAAALSREPATAVLPLLSPILRQRVQFLSASSTEPWIRLLSYDTAKAARLLEIARSDALEPHPVSGEVEVDWDCDVDVRYKRLDRETLQALVHLKDLHLVFRLVYCEGDHEGDTSKWRVGEVSIPDEPSAFSLFGGYSTITEAEKGFEEKNPSKTTTDSSMEQSSVARSSLAVANDDDDDDDDDSYWGRYDATPARTPAVKRSPAPVSVMSPQTNTYGRSAAEDAYFAQYDSIQPAMDPHDPDEVVDTTAIPPPLGLARPVARAPEETEGVMPNETQGTWTLAEAPGRSPSQSSRHSPEDEERLANLMHPRPSSASSHSSGSQAIARLEESAEKQDKNEFNIKQHIGRSIKSLFLLAQASGIDSEEFERLVTTELKVLPMMEEDN
jgi:hypothetical protein